MIPAPAVHSPQDAAIEDVTAAVRDALRSSPVARAAVLAARSRPGGRASLVLAVRICDDGAVRVAVSVRDGRN